MSSQISRREFIKLAISAALVNTAPDMHNINHDFEEYRIRQSKQFASASPNILLIVMDTVRALNMSLHGYSRSTTPNLERLAKEGVVFERAISPSPWTLPSHASFFTGHWPHELSTAFLSGLDGTYPTLAEILSSQGFLTAGFVGNNEYCSRETGLSRGFQEYRDFQLIPGQIILGPSISHRISTNYFLRDLVNYQQLVGRRSAEKINSEFWNWLNQIEKNKPFFAFLNYFDAHDPYLPPEEYLLKFSPIIFRDRIDWKQQHFSPEEVNHFRDAYDGAIAYMDQQVANLFHLLENAGILKDTIVFILSDHGEQFGEHGLMGHFHNLFFTTLHVPMIVYYPNKLPGGIRIKKPISLRDIPATILDLLNLDPEISLPGKSFREDWEKSESQIIYTDNAILSEVKTELGQPAWYPISRGEMHSIIVGDNHYILNGDGVEEMYNFENDPFEQNDLSKSSQYKWKLSECRSAMKAILKRYNG